MNGTNATFPNTTSAPTVPSSSSLLSISAKQGIYWSVASIALFSNLFFCTSLARKRRTIFRKPYTIIVFTLGITDIMTGLFLFITPRYVFKDTFPQPSSALGLRLFCTLIWARTPLFYFGVVSMYLTILLTVDRWFAVVRPTEYENSFTRKRALVGIALACLLALVVISGSSPEKAVHPERPVGKRCSFVRAKPVRYMVTSTVAFFFKTVLPFLAIAGLYLHMFYKLKTGSHVTQQHSSAIKKRITKVAALATLLFLFCFCPNMVAFQLHVFGKLSLLSTTKDLTAILVFANSCVNPYIYGLTVHKYRRACRDMLKSCCPCVFRLPATAASRRIGHEGVSP